MGDAGILPPDVRELVLRHIPTPVHLDVVLLLAGHPERVWTAEEVERAQQADQRVSSAALRDLAGAGLVAAQADPEGFRFAPESEALRSTVGRLLEAHNRTPVQLIRAVYDRPPPALQSFADAFRIQKRESR